ALGAGLFVLVLKRPRDRNHHLAGGAQLTEQLIRVSLDAKSFKYLVGPAPRLAPADPAGRPGFKPTTDREVLEHGEFREHGTLLVDEMKPEVACLVRVDLAQVNRFTTHAELARVGRLDPGQDLDQGRLAGSVAAKQRVDLAGP